MNRQSNSRGSISGGGTLKEQGTTALKDMEKQLFELRQAVMQQRASAQKVQGRGQIWSSSSKLSQPQQQVNEKSSLQNTNNTTSSNPATNPPVVKSGTLTIRNPAPNASSGTSVQSSGLSQKAQGIVDGIRSFDVFRGDFLIQHSVAPSMEERRDENNCPSDAIEQYLRNARKAHAPTFTAIEEYEYNEQCPDPDEQDKANEEQSKPLPQQQQRQPSTLKTKQAVLTFCIHCHKVVSDLKVEICGNCGKCPRNVEEYDEAAAAAEFQQALLEWRNGGKATPKPSPSQNAVQQQQQQPQPRETKKQHQDKKVVFEECAHRCGKFYYFNHLMKAYNERMLVQAEEEEEENVANQGNNQREDDIDDEENITSTS